MGLKKMYFWMRLCREEIGMGLCPKLFSQSSVLPLKTRDGPRGWRMICKAPRAYEHMSLHFMSFFLGLCGRRLYVLS